MSYIDLHIHSIYSDGHFTPQELIERAKQNDVNFLAISDHDSIRSLHDMKNLITKDMYSTSSVEISSSIILDGKKYKLHILGYGFDENNPMLLSLLNELREKRLAMHKYFLEDLKKYFLELPLEQINQLDIEKYCWFDREVFSCIKSNVCDLESLNKYSNYFQKNKLRYGPNYPIDSSRVINAINGAGGISVLAHPMAYGLSFEQMQKIIKKLVELGIQGLEVYQSDCSGEDSFRLLGEASKYNLLFSVGSDFHRVINSDGRDIGLGIDNNLCITETSLTNKLLEKNLVFHGKK